MKKGGKRREERSKGEFDVRVSLWTPFFSFSFLSKQEPAGGVPNSWRLQLSEIFDYYGSAANAFQHAIGSGEMLTRSRGLRSCVNDCLPQNV